MNEDENKMTNTEGQEEGTHSLGEKKNGIGKTFLSIWQKVKKPKFLFILMIIIVIISIGVAAGFYLKVKKLQLQSQIAGTSEIQKMMGEVGKLIFLPKDEEPTIATISDVEKLRGQPFFANAKNGDKVLIYTKAQKAILYDPVAKIVVEVAPLGNEVSGNVGDKNP